MIAIFFIGLIALICGLIAAISADSAEYQGQKDAAIMSNLGKMLSAYPQLIDYYRVTNWDGIIPETMLGDTNALIGVN